MRNRDKLGWNGYDGSVAGRGSGILMDGCTGLEAIVCESQGHILLQETSNGRLSISLLSIARVQRERESVARENSFSFVSLTRRG